MNVVSSQTGPTPSTPTAKAKAGDILECSWGYERTNVDFYQVVRATAHSVWLRPIWGRLVDQRPGAWILMPQPDQFADHKVLHEDWPAEGKRFRIGKPDVHGLRPYWIKISYYRRAAPWNGEPVFGSSPDVGH